MLVYNAKRYWIFLLGVLSLYNPKLSATPSNNWFIDEASKIEISAKYTFGTHKLSTHDVSGHITESKGHYSGEITVPIASIKEGNPKLECHLQEALGLNYDKSDYPDDHVCTAENKLPSEGPDSISYPEIKFKIDRIQKIEDRFSVTGQWKIHGISKIEKMEIMFKEKDSESMKLQGKLKFNLQDYGVIVKKAFVISVDDEVEVSLDLNLRKRR